LLVSLQEIGRLFSRPRTAVPNSGAQLLRVHRNALRSPEQGSTPSKYGLLIGAHTARAARAVSQWWKYRDDTTCRVVGVAVQHESILQLPMQGSTSLWYIAHNYYKASMTHDHRLEFWIKQYCCPLSLKNLELFSVGSTR